VPAPNPKLDSTAAERPSSQAGPLHILPLGSACRNVSKWAITAAAFPGALQTDKAFFWPPKTMEIVYEVREQFPYAQYEELEKLHGDLLYRSQGQVYTMMDGWALSEAQLVHNFKVEFEIDNSAKADTRRLFDWAAEHIDEVLADMCAQGWLKVSGHAAGTEVC